jgi:hypothetical protein
MAHFAELDDNNIVTRVISVVNEELTDNGQESEAKGISFCQAHFGGRWIQTSYSGSKRKRFAGVGHKYDSAADVFISPQPFPSWSLDANHDWQPPVPMPTDETKICRWNESAKTWDYA